MVLARREGGKPHVCVVSRPVDSVNEVAHHSWVSAVLGQDVDVWGVGRNLKHATQMSRSGCSFGVFCLVFTISSKNKKSRTGFSDRFTESQKNMNSQENLRITWVGKGQREVGERLIE